MPIQIEPISAINLFQIKSAIEKLGREALKLENPSQSGQLYVTTVPTVMDEGSAIFYVSGATYRIYFKINGQIKFVALT